MGGVGPGWRRRGRHLARRKSHPTLFLIVALVASLVPLALPSLAQENLPPEVFDGFYQTKVNRPVDIFLDALDPEGDPITFSIVTPPSHGTIDPEGCPDGFCTYTPDPDFTGTDSFTWTASDGTSTSSIATTTIEVLDTSLRVTPLSEDLTPQDLAAALAGSGVTISNVVFTGNPIGAGLFTGGSEPIGFESGVVLGSGAVANVVGPNLSDSETTALDAPGDADLDQLSGVSTVDATILEFDLTPTSDQLVFQYVFASEEYNEFVNSAFNDAFGFFINGVNCAVVNGDPVTINTINNGNPYGTEPNSHPELFRNNDLDDGGGDIDTEMDGLTVVLSCTASVNPNEVNAVKLAIADGSDSSLDSAVFLAQGSFVSNTAPVADDQSVTTTQDTPVPITLTATDAEGDLLSFEVVTQPTNGTLSGDAPNLTYTPNPGFVGPDSFTFKANDGFLDSNVATVSITVQPLEGNQPPTVDAGGPYEGTEGSPVTLTGTASDADEDTLSFAWSYVAGEGVDDGATCSFSAPTSLETDVTCTDDGDFTVTLTVSDEFNEPVDDSAMVTLANALPLVNITSPEDGSQFAVGDLVNVLASFSDPGTNDFHTCSIDWGDDTVTDGVIDTGTCSGSHTYSSIGNPTVTVFVTDDDEGQGQDSIQLSVVEAPSEDQVDLSIGKVDEPDPVTVGQKVAYFITVANNSDVDASGVTVLDTVDTGTILSGSGMGWTCILGEGEFGAGSIDCTLDGALTAGSTAPVLTVLVEAPAEPGTITQTATVSSEEPDTNLDDNTAVEQTTIVAASEGGVTGFLEPGDELVTDGGVTSPDNPVSAKIIIPEDGTPGVYTIAEFNDPAANSKGAVVYTGPDPSAPFLIQVSCDESKCPIRSNDLFILVQKENPDGTTQVLPSCEQSVRVKGKPTVTTNPPPCVVSVVRNPLDASINPGDLVWTVKVFGADPTIKSR